MVTLYIALFEAIGELQSDIIVFDLKAARMSLRGSITMQCSLSAGKQN